MPSQGPERLSQQQYQNMQTGEIQRLGQLTGCTEGFLDGVGVLDGSHPFYDVVMPSRQGGLVGVPFPDTDSLMKTTLDCIVARCDQLTTENKQTN